MTTADLQNAEIKFKPSKRKNLQLPSTHYTIKCYGASAPLIQI